MKCQYTEEPKMTNPSLHQLIHTVMFGGFLFPWYYLCSKFSCLMQSCSSQLTNQLQKQMNSYDKIDFVILPWYGFS